MVRTKLRSPDDFSIYIIICYVIQFKQAFSYYLFEKNIFVNCFGGIGVLRFLTLEVQVFPENMRGIKGFRRDSMVLKNTE